AEYDVEEKAMLSLLVVFQGAYQQGAQPVSEPRLGLREEIRIKNERLARIPASQRPHYRPTERLAILELRALRGWSMAQTARVFYVTQATITSWGKRLDEEGPAALLRTPVPVNKFPDLVAHLVQRLQVLCPRLGKVKIAQVLARAGLHLGVSSVGRMRRRRPTPGPPGRVATMSSAGA